MKVGLYFGSFNPPHIGHTLVAEYMLHHLVADEVWMMVSPQNPFKEKAGLLDEASRLELVKLAIGENKRIMASDFEFSLPKPSYTIDTMEALEQAYPEHEFFLIMGSDNIKGIRGWKEYERLIKSYEIAVYPRPGYELTEDDLSDMDGRILLTDAPSLDLSSTAIRTSLREGIPCRYWMREAVWGKVEEEGFYRSHSN